MNKNPSLIGGLILIGLGLLFLVNVFIPVTWPIAITAVGVAMLAWAVQQRERYGEGMGLSGLLTTTLGLILFYQNATQNWQSWYYLWPLLFAAVGAGMLLNRWLATSRNSGVRYGGARYLRVSTAFIVLGLVASVVLWFVREQLSWPSIIWGMGAMFSLAAIAGGLSPLLIPGTILGGLGALLAYQKLTGDWASWAYAWALIPGFVGVGLFLAFLNRRVPRIVGLSMAGWSLFVFFIFGVFFAGDGRFVSYWPVLLILAGTIVLVQTLLVSRRPVLH